MCLATLLTFIVTSYHGLRIQTWLATILFQIVRKTGVL
jgi:hypothetical protein